MSTANHSIKFTDSVCPVFKRRRTSDGISARVLAPLRRTDSTSHLSWVVLVTREGRGEISTERILRKTRRKPKDIRRRPPGRSPQPQCARSGTLGLNLQRQVNCDGTGNERNSPTPRQIPSRPRQPARASGARGSVVGAGALDEVRLTSAGAKASAPRAGPGGRRRDRVSLTGVGPAVSHAVRKGQGLSVNPWFSGPATVVGESASTSTRSVWP